MHGYELMAIALLAAVGLFLMGIFLKNPTTKSNTANKSFRRVADTAGDFRR